MKLVAGGAVSAMVVAVLWACHDRTTRPHEPEAVAEPVDYDPCCGHPCQHQGVCVAAADGRYTCDCTSIGYYGVNCTVASFETWLYSFVRVDHEVLQRLATEDWWVMRLINSTPFLYDRAIKYLYVSHSRIVESPASFESDHSYTTLDAYYNETYFARTLPPVPVHCPTPMGVAGRKELPDVDDLISRVFLRRKFIPDPHNTNLLFQYYAQHFNHMQFRTDAKKGPQFTKGNSGVDVSHIYGLTEDNRQALRHRQDGKLKHQVIDGEVFPPYLENVQGYHMDYPARFLLADDTRFALGHPFFALLPGLFAISTIWLREHNRVCDILKQEHPHWDDERLYQTARLILTGENIKIILEQFVPLLNQFKLHMRFRPHVVHGEDFQYHNKISLEFNLLYHWHNMVPDGITVNGSYYSLQNMFFSTKEVFTHGLDTFIDALVNNRAGQMTARNHPKETIPVLKRTLAASRQLRFQSFNQYRKRFDMRPFKDFLDLTGDQDLANDLQELYGDIDAVEYFVGLMVEEPGPSVMPLSLIVMGGSYSLKGLISSPICSPNWWKPSTFGGQVGFDIVNTASLEKLFCQNMKTKCKDISYYLPTGDSE